MNAPWHGLLGELSASVIKIRLPHTRNSLPEQTRIEVAALLQDRLAEAVTLFCYQESKWIGSFAAALGGLDTLVFSGGIGENPPVVRTRICEGLGLPGVELGSSRDAKTEGLISPDSGGVAVRVIRTDEQLMIARPVARVLALR